MHFPGWQVFIVKQFHGGLFLRAPFRSQYWFRQWLVHDEAASHCVNKYCTRRPAPNNFISRAAEQCDTISENLRQFTIGIKRRNPVLWCTGMFPHVAFISMIYYFIFVIVILKMCLSIKRLQIFYQAKVISESVIRMLRTCKSWYM